jgi:mannobiose 2-epimerase
LTGSGVLSRPDRDACLPNRQVSDGRGYELTRNRVYLDALRRGADFLLAHFRDPQYGGWFYSVNPEGKVLRDYKDCYGHSFTLFGLSHAARITGDERYRRAALDTWAEMKKNLRERWLLQPQTDRPSHDQRTNRRTR